MDSNTNKETEAVDAPPIASTLEQAAPDLTVINETVEQGESPAILAEVKHLEKPVEVLIPKAENCNNQEKLVDALVSKEGNDLKKLVDTVHSKESEDDDRPVGKETKKDLSINYNIETNEANISTDNINNGNNQSPKNHEAKNSATDKPIESKKPKKGRPRLTKGARRRFKWLIEKGHTPEEARRLAAIPSANSGVKRILGESSQPASKKTKTVTPNTSQGYIVPPSFSTPDANTGCIKIGILSKKYPDELLTTEQLKSIEATILERIVTQKEGEVKPKFLGTTFKLGFMIISCADRATSVWLKNAIDKIKPWEEASLLTVKEDKIPHTQILNAYFFNSIDDPNDKILGFIGAQNDGLNVGEWKVIQRKEDNIAVHLVFSADRKSVENLRKQDFKINYKFGQVHITLKETPVTTQNKPIPKVKQKQAYSSKPNKRFRHPPPSKASSWYSYGAVESTSRIDPSIFYNR